MSSERPSEPNIPASQCTVAHICGPGATGAAMYIHDTSECWVICQERNAPGGHPRLPLEARVSLEAKGCGRARLGEFLAGFCDAAVFIPALTAAEPVTMTMSDTTLAAVLAAAGLVVGGSGPDGK